MSPKQKTTLIACCAACLVAGYLVALAPGLDPLNPFVPRHNNRPILRLLAKVAKLGLWAIAFADHGPQSRSSGHVHYASVAHDRDMVSHREGW
jgi:hypothetical protein